MNCVRLKMNKDYIYYGLFLSDYTKEQIKKRIRHIDGYNTLFEQCDKVYLDHCTLLHCSQEDKFPQVKEEIDELVKRGFERYSAVLMQVTHIGYLANKAMAVKVNLFDFPCANANPHITVCTFGDGKPVDSNKIVDWDELDESIVIYGSLGVVKPNKR